VIFEDENEDEEEALFQKLWNSAFHGITAFAPSGEMPASRSRLRKI